MSGSNLVCPPPAAATDHAFLLALNPAAIAHLVRTHLLRSGQLLALHADYVRWKEQDGSLVGYRATLQNADGTNDAYVTVRTAPLHRLTAEAERLDHRADEEWSGLEALALLPQHGVLLLGFPLDRAMHDLRRLVRPSKVRSLVSAVCPQLIPDGMRFSKSRSTFALVRYKPERRAVLHWRIGCVARDGRTRADVSAWLRIHAEPTVARTALATAAAAAAGVLCPRTLGIAHDRLALESHVDGRSFQPNGDGLAAAASAVARLHAAAPPTSLPCHGPVHELDRVLRATDDLARLSPILGDQARALADGLAACVPTNSGLVFTHGDLHPGQILLGQRDAGLLDFDRACVSTPAHDLAAMHAQGVLADPTHGAGFATAFANAYRQFRDLPPAHELAWWTAAALLRAATQPFRALRADWPERTATLLDAAAHAMRSSATGAEA